MQVSAEIRWFWLGRAPEGLEHWFRSADAHGCPAGGGGSRTDEYLRDPGQEELGLKRRGSKPGVEVKGLVAVKREGIAAAPFTGPVETWTKLSTQALQISSTIAVEKQRWLRKFDTSGAEPVEVPLGENESPAEKDRALPGRGCNVELTRITVGGAEWWTLGFESFGALATVEDSLRATGAVVAARRPPPLGDPLQASYPAWLAQLA
jgi:hypothetical protein